MTTENCASNEQPSVEIDLDILPVAPVRSAEHGALGVTALGSLNQSTRLGDNLDQSGHEQAVQYIEHLKSSRMAETRHRAIRTGRLSMGLRNILGRSPKG